MLCQPALPSHVSIMADSLNLEDIVSRCGLTSEKLQKECSREVRIKIAAKLEDWKMVGHYLSMPPEELKAIERENDTENQRTVAMLDTWHKREGETANCWKLANALYQHGRRDLIESLCKAILSSAEESSQRNVSAEVSTTSNSGEKVPKNCGPGMRMIINLLANGCKQLID